MSSPVSELVVVRVFDAPRELVWRAFAEAERLARWWGPKGFEVGVLRLEFTPGGTFHYSMRSPEGHEMWGKFVYREIAEPERIVYVSSFSDPQGGLTRHPMWPQWPLEVLNTITLEARGHQTVLTLRGRPVGAPEDELSFFNKVQSGVKTGFGATFDQLEAYLRQNG